MLISSSPAGSTPRSYRRSALLVVVVALLLVAATGYAATRAVARPDHAGDHRGQAAPDVAEPGQPSVQRFHQDGVDVTVSLDGARPGPNLVRVDLATPSTDDWSVLVGTTTDDELGQMVVARPRAGVDGLWATVDLPRGTSTLLVSNGPDRQVPFPVDAGS